MTSCESHLYLALSHTGILLVLGLSLAIKLAESNILTGIVVENGFFHEEGATRGLVHPF